MGAPTKHEKPPVWYQADPAAAQPIGRTRAERDMLSTIDRKIAWERRCVEADPDHPSAGYRRQTIGALQWALARIAELERLERQVTDALPE